MWDVDGTGLQITTAGSGLEHRLLDDTVCEEKATFQDSKYT